MSIETQNASDALGGIAAVIGAVAQMLWVVLAFAALLIFKSEIKDLLKRIRKGRLLGQELELADDLRELHETAEAGKQETESKAQPAPIVDEPPLELLGKTETLARFDAPPTGAAQDSSDLSVSDILRGAIKSPIATLILLSREVELECRRALARSGLLKNRPHVSIAQAIGELRQHSSISSLVTSVELFQRVRNAIVHGSARVSDEEVLSAIDSGITILTALRSLPLNIYVVKAANIPLYSDSECTQLRPGIYGLILEAHLAASGGVERQVFPTRRLDYRVAMDVGVEWNLNLVTEVTWFIDPDSGEKKRAWLSAAEFVGPILNQ